MPSPIVTATLQAATLSTASNVFAQMLEAREEKVRPPSRSLTLPV